MDQMIRATSYGEVGIDTEASPGNGAYYAKHYESGFDMCRSKLPAATKPRTMNMNERAIELYKQAIEFAYTSIGKDHADTSYFQGTVAGKFAELIVRECCEVINAAKPGVVQVPAEVALDMTAKNVKAYFGVEE